MAYTPDAPINRKNGAKTAARISLCLAEPIQVMNNGSVSAVSFKTQTIVIGNTPKLRRSQNA